MFIGRWQPFHAGHKALLETRLNDGYPVAIAVRKTPRDRSNPYDFNEVRKKIMLDMAYWVKRGMIVIFSIPDIDAVCYGRDVGYKVIEIRLPEKIEQISATKIRENEDTNH